MTKVIFDIETIGKDFEQLDEVSREYLEKSFERYLKTEEEIEEAKDQLSFSPLTGEIVAVAMINQETSGGVVYFQAPNKKIEEFEENGIKGLIIDTPGIGDTKLKQNESHSFRFFLFKAKVPG